MPGIIPFFRLEDPDEIRGGLDIKHLRKLVKSRMRNAFYSHDQKPLEKPTVDSPGQTLLPLTDVTWP